MGFFRRILGEGGEPVVRRQTIKVSGPLEVRDGHPVLSEEMKAELERSGVDPAMVEAQLGSSSTEQGRSSSFSTKFTGNISPQDPSGRKMLEGHLEMRDGHPVLSDEIRVELKRRGIDPATVESQLANAPGGELPGFLRDLGGDALLLVQRERCYGPLRDQWRASGSNRRLAR